MQTLAAINTLATTLQVLMNAVTTASQVSAIIQKAQAEGRTTLTAEEEAAVRAIDDAARAGLVSAIEAH